MSLLEHDIPSKISDSALILRVLDGRLAGAEHRLSTGTSITIGHSLDSDIVLRGKETVGVSIELTTHEDSVLVKMLSGQSVLLGNDLGEGKAITLPAYVPLKIGEYNIAIGNAQSERWADANAIALKTSSGGQPADVPVVRPKLTDQTRSRWTSFMSYLPGWMKGPGFLMIAAFALVLLLAVEPLKQIVDNEINGVDDAQLAISTAGFPHVKVTPNPAGDGMLISGLVRDEAEMEKLRELVDRRFSGAVFDVETTQALARAANDFLAGQGIDAEAKATGIGKIRVTSQYLPIDRQNDLTKLLKKDLPKLAAVSFTLTGARGPEDLQYFFSSEKYGLATYVDGEPGHLVTADGSFWFEGATLPTGHKLVRASGGSISFERDGQIEEIRMGPSMNDTAADIFEGNKTVTTTNSNAPETSSEPKI